MSYRFEEVDKVKKDLRSVDYLADDGIAGIVYLGDRLQKPILVEGPAGTGKTQLAKSVADMTGSRLIRLQCYEGLDESKALYEWNYKKQLLSIQSSEKNENLFDEKYLIKRPILTALTNIESSIFLIDEIFDNFDMVNINKVIEYCAENKFQTFFSTTDNFTLKGNIDNLEIKEIL